MTAPEFRRCPIRGHRTIIAPDRAQRPIVTPFPRSPLDDTEHKQHNPFLAGNEDQSAAELLTIPGDGAWSVRVVQNLYPAFTQAVDLLTTEHELFQSGTAIGQQEVIVECPQFETELANLSPTQVADVLTAWQRRLIAIRTEGRFDYAFVFKNSGARAGASLPHAHSQLVAAQFVPDAIRREQTTAREYFDRTRSALQDAVISAERNAGRVVIAESEFVAFCPFASRFAYETCIAPRGISSFLDLSDVEFAKLSSMLHRLLNAFLAEHPGAAYNLLLHATPFSESDEQWFRWRLEICPRLAQLAGFELGTGWYVNSVLPVEAASQIRAHVAT